ncbi:MAG: type II CRISPR-associated endonuclease Cas1 [Methylomicrobium sp.]
MIKRIVDISEPAYLHARHRQLCIDKHRETVAQIPIEDLGVLILQHPAIVLTQAALIACQQHNVAVVFCDERHLPYSLVLPLTEAHSLHSKILRQQIELTLAAKKRLWQRIVAEKIANQIAVLQQLDKNAKPLERMLTKIKPGDSDNIEAQASQQYWHLLFGPDFRRDSEAGGLNGLLNYGYAVMRAMMARAIVGGGLHPTLGIKHSNQYNGLCLADDLMEPLRPWVDQQVYRQTQSLDNPEVDQQTKQPLLQLLSAPVDWNRQTMPLMVACHYWLADFKRAFEDRSVKLTFPRPRQIE